MVKAVATCPRRRPLTPLTGWITEAMLKYHLENAYGEEWFAHPEVGEFLRGLWASGESEKQPA